MECKLKNLIYFKKLKRPTTREFNTAVFTLRVLQVGLTINDLNFFEMGEVLDLITEFNNDKEKYPYKATQADLAMLR